MENNEYLITDLIEINKKKKKVYINYQLAFSLYNSEIRKYNIKLNFHINNEIYQEIMGELLPKRAKIRVMNLLKSKDYTEYSLRAKLKEGYYPEGAIDMALQYVKGYGYINDKKYVENYLGFKCETKSRLQITSNLLQKGIAMDLINEAFESRLENNQDIEKRLIEKLILKRCKDIMNITKEEKSKLLSYLMRKGFRIDLINCVIYEIVNK